MALLCSMNDLPILSSGVDPSKFAGGSGRIGEEVMRRGFGYGVDSAGRSAKSKAASANQSSARVISEDEDQDERI